MSRRRTRCGRAAAVALAALVASLGLPPEGETAVGDLTFSTCFADAGASGCTATTRMNQTGEVAVSPDGLSAYAVAIGDAGITHFSLGAGGVPSFAGCIGDGAGAPCTDSDLDSLSGATGVAVSSDGTSVYVAAVTNSTVTWFDRAGGGALAYDYCYEEQGGTDVGCFEPSAVPMLEGATGVAVRPGGSHVLVAADLTDTLVFFPRGAGGLLSLPGCFRDELACTVGAPVVPALDGATGVAISPDGLDAYVAARTDDAVSHFRFTGAPPLTYVGCYGNPAEGCVNHPGFNGARAVAVSPDGTSVYVASENGSSITHLRRAADGTLTFIGCISNGGVGGCIDSPIDSLSLARGVAVSPDGRSVYVASWVGNAVTEFDRAADGSLTFSGCVAEGGLNGCVDPPIDSLAGAHGVAVSPDGASVYVGSEFDSSLTHFSRERPPPTLGTGTTLPTTPAAPQRAAKKCKKKRKKKRRQGRVAAKKKKRCKKKRKKRR